MPINTSQRKQIADEIYAVLVKHTPPLTEDEKNAINADVGESLDRYTTGEVPPVEEAEEIVLDWPTGTSHPNKTYTLKGTTIFSFTVDPDETPGPGAFVVSPTGAGAADARYTSVISESPGGPPMPGPASSLEGNTTRTQWNVTTPDPSGYGYVTLMPGKKYSIAVTVLKGSGLTNIQLLDYA